MRTMRKRRPIGGSVRTATCSKQSQFPPAGTRPGDRGSLLPLCSPHRLRQTNPISGSGKEEASAWQERSYGESNSLWVSAKQSQFGDHGPVSGGKPCRTNPIFRWGPVGRGLGGTRGQMRQTKPISRQVRGTGAERCVQTNPIPATMPIRRSAFPGRQIVQNKPNLPGGAWGRGPWDVVQTKPISGGVTERVSALRERSYGE